MSGVAAAVCDWRWVMTFSAYGYSATIGDWESLLWGAGFIFSTLAFAIIVVALVLSVVTALAYAFQILSVVSGMVCNFLIGIGKDGFRWLCRLFHI